MSASHLPPLMRSVYERLNESPDLPHHELILRELSVVSQVVGLATNANLGGPPMDDLEKLRSSIVTVGSKFCPCCMRPYVNSEE